MDSRRLAFEMIKTDHFIKRTIDEKISATVGQGLTVPQAHVIGYISRKNADEDVFQKDIEEKFGLHRSSVSLMLNHMEEQGFIKRMSVDSDARLRKIILTEKAKKLQVKILAGIEEIENTMKQDLTEEEINCFFKVLDRIKNNL